MKSVSAGTGQFRLALSMAIQMTTFAESINGETYNDYCPIMQKQCLIWVIFPVQKCHPCTHKYVHGVASCMAQSMKTCRKYYSIMLLLIHYHSPTFPK